MYKQTETASAGYANGGKDYEAQNSDMVRTICCFLHILGSIKS